MKYSSFHPVYVSHNIEERIQYLVDVFGCKHAHTLDLGPYKLYVMESANKDKFDLIDIPNAPGGFWALRINVEDFSKTLMERMNNNLRYDDEAIGEELMNSYKVINHMIYLPSCKIVYMKDAEGLRFMIMEHIV